MQDKSLTTTPGTQCQERGDGGQEIFRNAGGYNKTSAKKKTLIILQADDKDYKTIVTVLRRNHPRRYKKNRHQRRYKKNRPMKKVKGVGWEEDIRDDVQSSK